MMVEEMEEDGVSGNGKIHLYNAWLPPAVAEESKREKESFASVVSSVKNSWNSEDPESVYSTLKWISIIQLYVKAKSEVSLPDVKAVVEVGLEIFLASQNKLYPQVRWGVILVRLLKKFGKKISLEVQWRPFYDMLMHTHFKRSTGPEGWRLRQRHFESLTSLVQRCRKFFPAGSASEIWSEFRPGLENPWHNSAFEVSGFVKLFLPMNLENKDFFTKEWIKEGIDLWELVPNCQFWDVQWASVFARCIKHRKSLDWEDFMPTLFTRYLNLFEVPISSRSGSHPFSLDVPPNFLYLFSQRSNIPAKSVANAIIGLLKPGNSAQLYFEKLTNLLEQYYHPSNGGRWTYSLERFLWHLTISFQKRLYSELNISDGTMDDFSLGKSERTSFVKMILKIIDRGQYSKSKPLSETVAATISVLSYVEPSLVLPFTASRFHLALETVTATHQLKAAITSVAFTIRPLLSSIGDSLSLSENPSTSNLLAICLSNSLLGLDANDPPKTLATMQLIASLFSNLTEINDNDGMPAVLQNISFSEWLDEFFDRLFSLLQHLEPSSTVSEGLSVSSTSETFLLDDSSYYFCMLEILLGKLSKPLFDRSLKKISKFVNTNILPGAVAEVGLLCCTCLYSNPHDASVYIIKPIVMSIVESLGEFPASGFGDDGSSSASFSTKATPSPALETTLEYQLKVLSAAISYGGPALLCYREELKRVVASAFNAHSWKIYGAGDHLLRSLLGSLILYYPVDQHKCISPHPDVQGLEEWICSKTTEVGGSCCLPTWHIPSPDEISFANELLDQHLKSALDTLLRICQTKIHSEAGNEKEHLKVSLLRIYSSLRGVQSCLPDLRPRNAKGEINKEEDGIFLISGAAGSIVGSSELREKASEVMHVACKYILEKRSDDSVLLILIIRIMDALGNFGSMEYEEWSNHLHSWKYESASTIEPPCNYIVSSSVKGKKRPRWAVIEKVYMHNIWRSSQSAYHKFRKLTNLSPSFCLVLLMEDLLSLTLHQYDSVRSRAGKTLLKILKRWPTLIGSCVPTLTEKLCNSTSSEHVVLGACSVLGSQTILRHLMMDASSFSSFVLGLLSSSHHESLKAQKSISELFVKYNIHFAGLPKSFFKNLDDPLEKTEFQSLVSKISSMSFSSDGLHWRYNLMANRVLLLLTLASRNDSSFSSQLLGETTGHFLRALKSQQPQSRMLAISALNVLLQGSHRKTPAENSGDRDRTSLEIILTQIFQEGDFLIKTLKSLSHVHVITDTDGAQADYRSLQSSTDKAITSFYFEFSSSWPRTPSWISLLGGSSFYSKFARIFKRLTQECGSPFVHAIRGAIEELVLETERPMQCVAAEALAGTLHSDISDLPTIWDEWVMGQFQKIISSPSVESIAEWAACVRYAVAGKGKYGARVPLLRQQILDCLLSPLPPMTSTSIMAKRYTFLSAACAEISPPSMPSIEVQYHVKLLTELWDNTSHSSAQVREAIGVALCIVCSNLRLFTSCTLVHESSSMADMAKSFKTQAFELTGNIQSLSPSENPASSGTEMNENGHADMKLKSDVRKMETMFHFMISSLRSGRSSYLLDMIVSLIYPIVSLQDTSHKDLSSLAKSAFRLLEWRVLPRPHLEDAVSLLLSSTRDPNWRTRLASLTYLRTFMYRHTFVLSSAEKQQIWASIEGLLLDSQVEVREHVAGVLASLMNGGDEDLAAAFRDRALAEANSVNKKRKSRNWRSTQSTVYLHGTVLALVATVLSSPYDMPGWLPEHVTLLAQFVNEPSPVKSTVTKAVAEFRRTHADTWIIQKDSFTEEQLEVLADASSSSSYFA